MEIKKDTALLMRNLILQIVLCLYNFKYQLRIILKAIPGESKILWYLSKSVIHTVLLVQVATKTTAQNAGFLIRMLCLVEQLAISLAMTAMALILQLALSASLALKAVRPALLQPQIVVSVITAIFYTTMEQTWFVWLTAQMEPSRTQLPIQIYAINATQAVLLAWIVMINAPLAM